MAKAKYTMKEHARGRIDECKYPHGRALRFLRLTATEDGYSVETAARAVGCAGSSILHAEKQGSPKVVAKYFDLMSVAIHTGGMQRASEARQAEKQAEFYRDSAPAHSELPGIGEDTLDEKVDRLVAEKFAALLEQHTAPKSS